MDSTTVQLKVYKKSLRKVIEILEKTSERLADSDCSKEYILETIAKDVRKFRKYTEKYKGVF